MGQDRLSILAGSLVVALLWSASAAAGPTDAEKCEADKIKRTAKYALCRLKADSKAVKKGQPADYTKCDTKIVDKFGNAETKYGLQCPTTGDVAAIQAQVTECADSITDALSGPRRVFVTSAGYDGNLGGLAGGDTKCQAAADAAGLGGTWTAWLSDSATDAKDRITDKGYVLVDGTTLVADSLADLLNCSNPDCLVNSIDQDENGDGPPVTGVWTGTGPDGTYTGFGCDEWTSASNFDEGTFGAYVHTTVDWTITFGPSPCTATPLHVYCFED